MTATTSPDPVEERRELPDSIQLGIWEWEGGQLHENRLRRGQEEITPGMPGVPPHPDQGRYAAGVDELQARTSGRHAG